MDFVRQVHSYVTENVKIADAKAGFVAAASAALLNVVAHLVATGRVGMPARFVITEASSLRLLVAIVALGVVGMSLCFACLALRPRLATRTARVAFPELSRMGEQGYAHYLATHTEADLMGELTSHTVELSAIAVAKNRMLRYAAGALIAGGLVVLCLVAAATL